MPITATGLIRALLTTDAYLPPSLAATRQGPPPSHLATLDVPTKIQGNHQFVNRSYI